MDRLSIASYPIVQMEFDYHSIMQDIIVNKGMRFSVWVEGGKYLMPTEVIGILKEELVYIITTISLDPDKIVCTDLVGKKFYFGHPGKVIGYGHLRRVSLD